MILNDVDAPEDVEECLSTKGKVSKYGKTYGKQKPSRNSEDK